MKEFWQWALFILLILGVVMVFVAIGKFAGESKIKRDLVRMCITKEVMIIKRDFADLKISCEVVK